LDCFHFICYHIYEGLNKQGLTQDELARKSGLPYTTLTKIESNVITKPTIQTVVKIAKGLGVNLDDLMK